MKSKIMIDGQIITAKIYDQRVEGVVLWGYIRYKGLWVRVWTSKGGMWFGTYEPEPERGVK